MWGENALPWALLFSGDPNLIAGGLSLWISNPRAPLWDTAPAALWTDLVPAAASAAASAAAPPLVAPRMLLVKAEEDTLPLDADEIESSRSEVLPSTGREGGRGIPDARVRVF